MAQVGCLCAHEGHRSLQRFESLNELLCRFCLTVRRDADVLYILRDIHAHQGRIDGSPMFHVTLQHVIYGVFQRVVTCFSLRTGNSSIGQVFRPWAADVL